MNARTLFLLACILAGMGFGWWWTQQSGSQHPSSRITRPAYLSPAPQNNTMGLDSALNKGNGAEPGNLSADSAQAAVSGNKSATQASDHDSVTPTYLPQAFSYHDGIMKVAPAVVSLYAAAGPTDSSGDAGRVTTSQGSGVLVDSDGIVLTNLHLVEGLDSITVVLGNGRSYPAILVGSDRETDLAVVKIPASNLPFVRLDEAPPLRVGDVVLAIGNPFGVGQTVTQGIVSATRRRIAGGSVWQNFVQIDAAINPGNSGGALINPFGQLVGVNTAVFRGDSGAIGIGFSIPADLLVQVVPQIIENGSVARGWLGIGVDDLTMFPDLARKGLSGAVITYILADSPASRGGLKPRDVVTHLGEKPIINATQLLLAVSALPPGATVKLTLLRRTSSDVVPDSNTSSHFERVDLKMRLGARPDVSDLESRQ